MRIFYFSVTQNQTQISSKTRRILKIAIPKLSKEMLKSEKNSHIAFLSKYYMAVGGFCFLLILLQSMPC